MNWNDLRFFLALARTGSVRGAGTALGVSHSTVGRRIDTLEAEVGVKLFDRHRGGFVLTDAGKGIVAAVEQLEDQVAGIERDLLGQDTRLAGPVSLTCCDHHVSRLVLHGLVPFLTAHPDIGLSVTTDTRPFDLAKREADLAIRILGRGTAPPPFLIAHQLGPVVVCNYMARAHAPTLDPDRPGTHPRWLGGDSDRMHEAIVAGSSYPNLPSWGAFSTIELTIQAASAGLGLIALPTYVGDAEPALMRLDKPDLRHMGDLWLLCHPDLRANARIRETRTAIRSVFRDHEALLRGERAVDLG